MNSTKEILNKSSVFGSLEDSYIDTLDSLFSRQTIQPGDILANSKDSAQNYFLLETGTILLSMDEDKSVVLNTPGDFIAMELLSIKGIYKTTLTVLEKGSVFVIPRQAFFDIIQEDTIAAATIMESWQEYLETVAPFAKNTEDVSLPEHF